MTVTNELSLLIDNVRYEVQYVDYEDNQWTVPVILTKERAVGLLHDGSISKVRFSPILNNDSFNFTFEPKYLTLMVE